MKTLTPKPALAALQQGVALLAVLMALVVLMLMLVLSSRIALTEMHSSAGSQNMTQGFAAAEGGLNVRANGVRALFVGYSRPSGAGPDSTSPCTGSNMGSGDFACQTMTVGSRTVSTYMQDVTKYDSSGNPESGTVGAGEAFTGLTYSQYSYTVNSIARRAGGQTEAQLQMNLQSRLVPLFQFATFYQRDLEFAPGANMTLNGRVHTNGNLYLNVVSGYTLNITGKVTAAGSVNHFGKPGDNFKNPGRVCTDTVNVVGVLVPCNGYDELTRAQLATFGGNLLAHQSPLTVPSMGSLAPKVGNQLWDQADVRIVANVKFPYSAASPRFEVRNANGTIDLVATNAFKLAGVMSVSSWQDYREGKRTYNLYNVDQARLFSAIGSGGFHDATGKSLPVNDTTGGGMVWNLSVDDGNPKTNDGVSSIPQSYAFRLGAAADGAADLGPPNGLQPTGLTVVSNQPVYTWGNYNTINKIPASILADAINVLSSNAPSTMTLPNSTSNYYGPTAAAQTTVNAAMLSGIDDTTTMPVNSYNGSVVNFTRFQENWTGKTFNYMGSLVSLGNSLHTNGVFSSIGYKPPMRNWQYDTSFNDAKQLPPLTPRFVYLRQVNFIRTY